MESGEGDQLLGYCSVAGKGHAQLPFYPISHIVCREGKNGLKLRKKKMIGKLLTSIGIFPSSISLQITASWAFGDGLSKLDVAPAKRDATTT